MSCEPQGRSILLIDFGSTYTKVTAVDTDAKQLLGTAEAFTTVETDINDGLSVALTRLEKKTGPLSFDRQLACSSAAGGLRMVTSGLVPELTAEAARLASLGAGAKVVKVYAFKLTRGDVREIAALKPDIFLLTGGIDGGDAEYIIHNAGMLAECESRFPVIIAGNRNAADECAERLPGWELFLCDNVMPKLGVLRIEPVQQVIRDLFLRRIIRAKGLSKTERLIDGILMPTPSAILQAMELLAKGTSRTAGLGDLVAVDLGGATTDVYSIASGAPKTANTILKGFAEPYAKRTVEGDIGMRYSASGVLEAVGVQRLSALSGLGETQITQLLSAIRENPGLLPQTAAEEALDNALAAAAVETAFTRHAGTLEQVYTPMGPAYSQSGKDLTGVETLVMTGGAIIHNKKAGQVAAYTLYNPRTPASLKPKRVRAWVDRSYILAAMGLLGEADPDTAVTIMKKELEDYGTVEQAAV